MADSIHVAYVAEALESMDDSLGYDEAADMAAELLKRRSEVEAAAARYASGDLSEWGFKSIVRDCAGK